MQKDSYLSDKTVTGVFVLEPIRKGKKDPPRNAGELMSMFIRRKGIGK